MLLPDRAEPKETRYSGLKYRILRYGKLSSTSQAAKEMAKMSPGDNIVILADAQTHGKGRRGRRWFSPKGGLWFSLVLRPRIRPMDALRLTFLMCSAVVEALRMEFELNAEVRWPNDILVNSRKICGILTEAATTEEAVEFVVIGVGLNANVDLEAFPTSLRSSLTTLQRELGRQVNLETLTERILRAFDRRYDRLQAGCWSQLLEEWKVSAGFLGRDVKIISYDEVLQGKAFDVDEDGSLAVKLENGTTRRVLAGDVTLVRP